MILPILILLLNLVLWFYQGQPQNQKKNNQQVVNRREVNFKSDFYRQIIEFEKYNPIEFQNLFKYLELLDKIILSDKPCKLNIQLVKDITNSIIDKYHNLYYSLPTDNYFQDTYNQNYKILLKYLRDKINNFIDNCRESGFKNVTTMSYLQTERELPYEKNDNYTVVFI